MIEFLVPRILAIIACACVYACGYWSGVRERDMLFKHNQHIHKWEIRGLTCAGHKKETVATVTYQGDRVDLVQKTLEKAYGQSNVRKVK